MEIFSNLGLGLETAFTLTNLMYCLIGVFVGTAVGVLPGLGPIATIAMLLPATFGLPPISALIMLSGIYYGAQYGGSTTAILVNLPGESSSVVTAIDGYQMARKGHAGKALATAALASFFAGTVATILLALFAPPLADLALKFGPAEYFSLMVLGLVASVVLASGSLLQRDRHGHPRPAARPGRHRRQLGRRSATPSTCRNWPTASTSSSSRWACSASAKSSATSSTTRRATLVMKKVSGLMLTKEDFKRIIAPVLRGTVLGSALGILPGGGAMLASFAAYSIEKKVSKNSAQFGKGAIEGVAAPEAANNAGAQTSFIPMLTLGIPSNPVMALMIGAMIIQGIQPGPAVMTEQPALFWGLIVSMWFGNLFLVVLNLPMIGLWVKMITVPYHRLYPAILMFCAIGVFSLNNSEFDVWLMALFGLFGYICAKLDAEPAPMLLGFIIGPMMEEYLRRALLLSHSDPMVFVTRPISAVMLGLAVAAMVVVLLPSLRKKREEAFHEE